MEWTPIIVVGAVVAYIGFGLGFGLWLAEVCEKSPDEAGGYAWTAAFIWPVVLTAMLVQALLRRISGAQPSAPPPDRA